MGHCCDLRALKLTVSILHICPLIHFGSLKSLALDPFGRWSVIVAKNVRIAIQSVRPRKMCSLPGTHMVARNCFYLQFLESSALFGLLGDHAYM